MFYGASELSVANAKSAPSQRGLSPTFAPHSLVWLVASAVAVLGTGEGLAKHKSASSEDHHKSHKKGDKGDKADKEDKEAEHHKGRKDHKKEADKNSDKVKGSEHHKHVVEQPATEDGAPAVLSPDLVITKQALDLGRHGKGKDATALAASIGDPVAVKLVEWAQLRRSDSDAGLSRYLGFIAANPEWPSIPMMRRRAEARLWQERRDAATVRQLIGNEATSAIGRLVLARIEIVEGNRAHAESEVRAVWQSEPLSAELETAVLAAFPDVLTREDHVARMDRRIGAGILPRRPAPRNTPATITSRS